MIAHWRGLVLPALFTLLVGVILVSLGLWQLERLAWKQNLLAKIEARSKADATPLPPPNQWATLDPRDYEYRRVTLRGRFDNAKETPVFRTSETGPGYLIVTPMHLDQGGTVLVDRGFVPEALKSSAARPAGQASGPVTVVGLMRGPESRNAFTPPDDPGKDIFFTRDPVLIAAHDGLKDAAPFTVDADATPNPGGWPRGAATEVAIPNNHFSYAMTWFGLALALAGVFLTYAWRRLVGPSPDVKGAEAGRQDGNRLGLDRPQSDMPKSRSSSL